MNNFIISVSPEGTITTIYDDALHSLFEEGHVAITRASMVEPTPSGKWIADMTPAIERYGLECDNPILGPFHLRQTALDEERRWLEERLFGGVA